MERKTFAARSNKDVFRHSLLSAADATWKNFHLVRHSMALWVCLSDRNCRMASSRAMPTIVMELHNSTLYITLALTVWRATLPFPTFIIFHLRFSCFSWFVSCLQVSQRLAQVDPASILRDCLEDFAVIFGGYVKLSIKKWTKRVALDTRRKIENDENISPLVCLRLFSMATARLMPIVETVTHFFSPLLDSLFFCEMKLHRLTCRRGQKKTTNAE